MRRPVVDLAASVRARLLAYSRDKVLAFDLVLTRFALERFLDRLARSRHADSFVLKGGMLVMTWFDDPLRGTRDLDLLGFGDAAPDRLRATFAEIMAIHVDDAIVFDGSGVTATPIRENAAYGGVRLRTIATLAAARIPVVIDVAFGDSVEPGLLDIEYPVLLDFPRPRIRAYAPETVIAEKFEAMVVLGRANSRMKDLYDVWSLLRSYDVDLDKLATALTATFARRGTALPAATPDVLTSAFAEDGGKDRQWRAFVADLAAEGPMLSTIVADLAVGLMPVVEAAIVGVATAGTGKRALA